MDSKVELISDGEGLAVIGSSAAVERFLASEGLASKELAAPKLSKIMGEGGAAAQVGADVMANSGRWVKLTTRSAQDVAKYGLQESRTNPGVFHAMVGQPGKIKSWVQIEKAPSALRNPAALANVGVLMAQLAMQQQMDEIADYLRAIDEKLGDVLRNQKDTVLAEMIGVDLVVEEALSVWREVGRVSEVTWSKVKETTMPIAKTQAYALRQLEGLADKVESKAKIGELAKSLDGAQSEVREWLAVLARCFQLQEAIAVLELERVENASPDELDQHRLGLRTAREHRLELISRATERLLARMDAAAELANGKVLLHPTTSPQIVRSSAEVRSSVFEVSELLGIGRVLEPVDARRWSDAANEVRDKALSRGASGLDAARREASEGVGRAKLAVGRFTQRLADKTHGLRESAGPDPSDSGDS